MSLGRNLKRLMKAHGPLETLEHFYALVQEGRIQGNQVNLKDLAISIVGDDWEDGLRTFGARSRLMRGSGGDNADQTLRVLESGAGEAVDASFFADITGQLLINEIRRKFTNPTFIGDRLMEKVPITNGNLGTQKTPWLSDVVFNGDQIQQGMPYPHAQFNQQYQTYPAPEKHGLICSVTMEMIYSDLTNQAMDSAGSVGKALGYKRELAQLDVVLGNTNNFNFLGSAYNTYNLTAPFTNGPINRLSDENLVNWTQINNLEQLFTKMTDPATGRRIFVEPKFMLVPPALKYTARRVIHATQTRSGNEASDSGNLTVADNPLDRNYEIVTSPLVYERLVNASVDATKASNYFWLLDPFAFIWREVYGLRTESAPKGNILEFNQDIAVQVKAGYYGVAAVRSPWHVVINVDT